MNLYFPQFKIFIVSAPSKSFDVIISSGTTLTITLLKDRAINEIVNVRVERSDFSDVPVGSILKGRIKRYHTSLDSYFVDVGFPREAFLQKKKGCENLRIGDTVLVQLQRKEDYLKGAKLTCAISLPGRYIVYLPHGNKVAVSSKIKNKKSKLVKRVKEFLKKHLEEGEGVILRSASLDVEAEEILDELKNLRSLWENIKRKAETAKIGVVFREAPFFVRIIRDNWINIKEIIVDSPAVWEVLIDYFGKTISSKVRYVKELNKYLGDISLNQIIDRILSKHVWLKGGGFLIIEETEAMTVVDVNSGEGCGKNLEESALKANIEAVEELARQIRLKNLGGIIIVDLINLKEEKSREELLKRVREILSEDNVKIYGLTKLGLLELTRKRDGESNTKILSEECPTCEGRGAIRSKECILFLLEKELGEYISRYVKVEIEVHERLYDSVVKLVERKNWKDWVSIKKVWKEDINYYRVLPL